jgi:hypothetical protein
MEGSEMAEDCVFEYARKSLGRIRVTDVIDRCGISRMDAVRILEELKAKGYLGGNLQRGYWFIRTRKQPNLT